MNRDNFIHHGSDDDEPQQLIDISGVTLDKVLPLARAGYHTPDDVRRASQSELAEVDGIGNALAARMKADVGGLKAEPEPSLQPPAVGRPISPGTWMRTQSFDDFFEIDEADSSGPDSDTDDEIESFVDQLERVVSDEFDETDREIITILTEHLLDDAE